MTLYDSTVSFPLSTKFFIYEQSHHASMEVFVELKIEGVGFGLWNADFFLFNRRCYYLFISFLNIFKI